MRELALSSRLFSEADVTHIRNCVDPQIFDGQARHKMRAELGLLPTDIAVLFSAANQPRKGALIIADVLKHLCNGIQRKNWRFLFMGGLPPNLEARQDVVILPRTTDEARVASYYAASDIYALPSLEDNLPNTVSESLCCGTPVAAFPTGGIVEMVRDGMNGTLSRDQKAASFQEAIQRATTALNWSREAIAQDANNIYSPTLIANVHKVLFQRVATSF